MDAADKRMLEREALRNMIQQWNANRLDLFELSEPNENLEFHGVMRFYFQDSGQKIATKCIRVASDATVSDVIETLIEKFRPDMRMLSLGSYSLWETHGPDDERRLEPHEKPLLVQLNWHADDREGRFLLKCTTNADTSLSSVNEKGDQNFKRKLSKREKKELKKKEKLSRLKSDSNNENRPVAEKLYTELPETSFTRSISNPEAVMRRRRQQKLERKLQQFRSKDGGPDTGGTLKIYGSSLCPDVPYKTLLLSVGDTAAGVVREMLDKYGLSRHDPQHFCIVQVDATDNSESILEDDECPLAIVMTHPHRSSIMFHVRRRPAESQPRRRKKKTAGCGAGCGAGGSSARPGCEPVLVELAPDGAALENGRRVRITGDMLEVGSGNGTALQLYGPSIQPRHCVVASGEAGGYIVTPLHADAHVYVNGRRAVAPHSLPLQHGCLLKFGRVSTFRFVDPNQENLLNRNLSQSQHFGSGSIYDRSPEARVTSPTSADAADDYRPMSPDRYSPYRDANDTLTPYNNNTLKLDNDSVVSHLNDSKEDYLRDDHTPSIYDQDSQNRTNNSQYKDNYETTFDLDGNVETKSICSAKSGGSGHDNRMSATVGSAARPGQEAILPAVLEFPEAGQAQFLAAVITRLDPHAPAFKLAPVYTLYLCARYRASTHYRPELTPTERAHKLTAFLHHVATLIHATVQERCTDSAAQAFWMANASELLHFLKCDRHISSFSTQAQELLPATVQNAFSNLVSCFQEELSRALGTLTNPALTDATEATAPTLQALAAAMVLLRRCRVNAALTIQLFSHLFHYINAVCFNKLVTEPGTVSARWGSALAARLALLAAWAERQGLELPADCHLARTHQAARLISGTYRTAEEVRAALAACFKLNSVQVRALLTPLAPPDVVDAAAHHARALADELCRADGREITLEESSWLGVGLLIPGDGFSAEVVRGVPPGLAEFVAPLQRGALCRLAHQPHARGVWTVYMAGYGAITRRPPDPAVHIIQLNKNSNGMGLSIVAAKGAGQSKLGIYIKSVVPGGAAAADARLAAGDQLLSVDGQSLVGITQEKAAEYLVRTGPTVTLEVAKQGAVLHGLATLLHQPAYNNKQELVAEDGALVYEPRLRRNSGTYTNPHPALLRPASPRSELATAGPLGAARRASERDLPARLAAEPVKPSKSTPALHHAAAPADTMPPLPASVNMHPVSASVANVNQVGAGGASASAWAGKSRSSHNLAQPQDGFYQNLPAHQHHNLHDRWSSLRSSTGSNRPQSAHYAPAPLETSPDSPQQHQQNQMNAISARSAKLAEMSEEVTRRQQMQYQLAQQKAATLPAHHNMMSPHHHYPNQLNIHPNMQPPMSPNMQQPMSPNMQSPMSPNMQQSMQAMQQNMQPPMSPNMQQAMSPNMQPPMSPNMQQSMQAMQQNMQGMQGNMQGMQGNLHQQHQHMQSPPPQQLYHNQHQPQQRYEWHPPGPPSPQRAQPPVAPKPQGVRRPESELEEQYHQHNQQPQQSTIQPDDERYVASALEPPPGPAGPYQARGPSRPGAPAADNPWQREERERQQEQRRAQARTRRDAAIASLLAIGSARTPAQNQQLRALQLEREFERRATQHAEDGAADAVESDPEPEQPERAPAPPAPPKSILKTNNTPRTDHTNGYAHDTSGATPGAAEAAEALGALALAPPPPERGSSFAVMATRARALSPPHHAPQPHQPPPHQHTPHSPPGGGRDKRVSFHERAAPAAAPPAPPAPPASSPPPLHDAPPHEDPDRFIEEAESMLAGGLSPSTPTTASVHTPGVIGAQEVYRDPRQRRLAEKQAATSAAPVPEQLSFKEKMKMFALEAGDPNTPKDKVKISRAQRDIDAVH